jgi:multidrug efflux pump subunit AcrA (membrane-fusion protein)
LAGLFAYRQLEDAGGLPPHSPVALGVPDGFKDGQRAAYVRERWLFRPGDLVDVSFEEPGTGAGLHVPMTAVREEAGKHYVYAIDRSQPLRTVANPVEIRLLGAVGQLHRIEPVEEGGLKQGGQVVLGGVHFLVPGQPVIVAEHKELPR